MIDWDRIKSTVSVSEILRKYGFQVPDHGKYAVLCPFHPERTASLRIDESKGLFHCFGCGAAGTVIDLVARFEKCSPKEAAERLSEELLLSPSTSSRISARKTLVQVEKWRRSESNEVSIPFDLRELPVGYRNISKKAINHFGLSLTDKGVFIPHFDLKGSRVGYSIRQPDGVLPKYLNSVGFPKGIPYGLYQNKDNVIDKGFCIVTEGQFDTIKLWDRGYRNAVSVLGSSILEQQAHLLLAITTRLLLLFDGDKAGRAGAEKVNRRWNKVLDIRVALLDEGYDPADLMDLISSESQ